MDKVRHPPRGRKDDDLVEQQQRRKSEMAATVAFPFSHDSLSSRRQASRPRRRPSPLTANDLVILVPSRRSPFVFPEHKGPSPARSPATPTHLPTGLTIRCQNAPSPRSASCVTPPQYMRSLLAHVSTVGEDSDDNGVTHARMATRRSYPPRSVRYIRRPPYAASIQFAKRWRQDGSGLKERECPPRVYEDLAHYYCEKTLRTKLQRSRAGEKSGLGLAAGKELLVWSAVGRVTQGRQSAASTSQVNSNAGANRMPLQERTVNIAYRRAESESEIAHVGKRHRQTHSMPQRQSQDRGRNVPRTDSIRDFIARKGVPLDSSRIEQRLGLREANIPFGPSPRSPLEIEASSALMTLSHGVLPPGHLPAEQRMVDTSPMPPKIDLPASPKPALLRQRSSYESAPIRAASASVEDSQVDEWEPTTSGVSGEMKRWSSPAMFVKGSVILDLDRNQDVGKARPGRLPIVGRIAFA